MSPASPKPEPSSEDLRRAERATWILYGAMALLGALPLILLWWLNRGR